MLENILNKMKRALSISVMAMLLILIMVLGVLTIFNIMPKNAWIKNKDGIYIQKGNPPTIPTEVSRQQAAVKEALDMFNKEKASGRILSSQCLGTTTNNYAVDLVHFPRSQEDNILENQCRDFYEGKVSKFIEVNTNGQIARVYD